MFTEVLNPESVLSLLIVLPAAAAGAVFGRFA